MPDTNLSEDPDRTELADTRTAWAEDRTVLANERTFAGWTRTGMACIALALGLKAVFKDTEHIMLAKAIAEIFIVAAVLIFWASVVKSLRTRKRMTGHDVEGNSTTQMTVLAVILTTGAILTGVILWLL